MIQDRYNETVVVKRLTGTTKQTYSTHIAELSCCIQSRAEAIGADISTAFGKDLILFCDNADIVEGDRIIRTIDETDIEHRITGLKTFSDSPYNSHMEIIIRAFNS
jgi:hypothetical protein